MSVSLRPALSSLFDAIRGSSPTAVDSKVNRFQQPVQKVQRRPARFADGFEGAPAKAPRLASESATAAPKQGVTTATNLHRDAFEAATRKPVELAPKLAPRLATAAKARVNVMRF
jgi:hypothetical protein